MMMEKRRVAGVPRERQEEEEEEEQWGVEGQNC